MATMKVQTDEALEGLIASEDWTTNELAEYVHNRLDEYSALQRRSSILIYRTGFALSVVRRRVRAGWSNWLRQQGIARQTAYRAMNLYAAVVERGHGEDELADLEIMEAYRSYGVEKDKAEEEADVPATETETPTATPETPNGSEEASTTEEATETPETTPEAVEGTEEEEADLSATVIVDARYWLSSLASVSGRLESLHFTTAVMGSEEERKELRAVIEELQGQLDNLKAKL